jgi:phage-related protein
LFPIKETLSLNDCLTNAERFKIQFSQDASNFLDSIDSKAREKIIYNIFKAQVINDNELFKKLTNDIWEFRTLYNKNNYRLFAFWDKTEKINTIVIATHGLIKKTSKTPPADLAKAEKYRKLYLDQKINKK